MSNTRTVNVVLEKRYGLCSSDTITIELENPGPWENVEIMRLVNTAILNSWATSIERTEADEAEQEPCEEQQDDDNRNDNGMEQLTMFTNEEEIR